jgi:O-antigen/teichoic acid export membrane protein
MIVGSILGYIYWLLVSFLGGSDIVGIAGSVNTLSLLVSGIAVLGLPTGVQRFLGRDFTERNVGNLNSYFWSSLILTVALSLASTLVIWIIAYLNVPLLGFSNMMLISTALLVSLGFSGMFSALLVSMVRTWPVAISYTIASLVKLGSGIFLLHLGLGWFGAVMGIVFGNLSWVLLLLLFAVAELRHLGHITVGFSLKSLSESLRAGSVTWLPSVIALIGQQFGLLAVFSIQGGFEAGTFFVAYTIFGIMYILPSSFMSLLFPVLSGLSVGRKETASRFLKICLALACPPTAFLTFYSGFPLSLLGASYLEAAPVLTILSLSIIPLTIISAVNSLVYALGSYSKVLGLGLAVSIPQIMLYLLLIPVQSGFGAALSFLISAMIGLGVAGGVSRTVQFQVSKRQIGAAIAVPLASGLLSLLIGLDWSIGGIVILVTSAFLYGRLGVVQRADLAEIARGFASEETIAKAGSKLSWLLRIVYGE